MDRQQGSALLAGLALGCLMGVAVGMLLHMKVYSTGWWWDTPGVRSLEQMFDPPPPAPPGSLYPCPDCPA